MPGFDRTGPFGLGPGSGWGRGRCARAGAGVRGQQGLFRGPGRGFGRGLRAFCRRGAGGLGRGVRGGFGWRFRGEASGAGDEKQFLIQQKEWFQDKIRAIEERLARFSDR